MAKSILLLGARGYVGQAFAAELSRRNRPFVPLSRADVDYQRFDVLWRYLRAERPVFVINAAGFTGRPNVDACEDAKADTLAGNTLLPQTVAQACAALEIPWGHVSSGCIYAGAWVEDEGRRRIEPDLMTGPVRELWSRQPGVIRGFSETDEPNFSFRRPPCSFYSGTKALAEEAMAGTGRGYLWRLRIPFDEFDNGRNYLAKIQRYTRVYDNVNSLSHRGDFVRACLDLHDRGAAPGIYNVTNPGWVTTREVVSLIQRWLKPDRSFEFWRDDAEFYREGARTPRSNTVLDSGKLLAAGVRMRPVDEALDDALKNWRPATA